jgi:hypothetical protein
MQVEAGKQYQDGSLSQLKKMSVKLAKVMGQLEATNQLQYEAAIQAELDDRTLLQVEAAHQVEEVLSRVGLVAMDLETVIERQHNIIYQSQLETAKQMQTEAAHQVHQMALMLEGLGVELGAANQVQVEADCEAANQGEG